MAYQKKCYRSSPVNENIRKSERGNAHQSRGGGMTTPKRPNVKKRYATQPVETPVSPTWLAARAAKKLPLHPVKPAKPAATVTAQPSTK